MNVHGVVVHVPHASVAVPQELRQSLLLSDRDLAVELVRMTDAFTNELFVEPSVQAVVFPVSRLIVDPERFEEDVDEPMAAVGMGVIYERTSHGASLRRRPNGKEREDLLDRFYRPHHRLLTQSVEAAVAQHGRCLIVDGHSFSSAPLPHEPDQDESRPDICIGTDAFHTPLALRDIAASSAEGLGWSVEVDRPFAGTIVPLTHYRRDQRVASVMIEVNRRLYLNEVSGERLAHFAGVQNRVHELVRLLDAAVDASPPLA